MIKELVLSAEELFFLGKIMNGKHLNYRYVAAMDDIQKNHAAYVQLCRNSLCDKGVLHENLWGDMEIDREVAQFLVPIFEGEFESSVEVIWTGENAVMQNVFFHIIGENCIMSIQNEKQIKLRAIGKGQIDNLILSLMPEDYNNRQKPELNNLKDVKISRMIILKNVLIGKNASAGVFYECNGWLCEQLREGHYLVLSPKQFYNKASALLKGADINGIL